MRYIVERMRRFCGFVTGFVFFISGILKLLDPVGTGLIMKEYMAFMHIDFMAFAAKFFGTVFALIETVIGTALITGVWRRITAIAAMCMQGFFTLLTLTLVIFNPEMDCGCFGEATEMTHIETFVKNIVICILLGCAFIPLRGLGRPKKRKYVSFALVTLSVAVFTAYSWMYIPLVDFTDYKSAAELESGSHDADEDMYEAVFVYEKDGVQQSFTLSHLPDTTWKFISTETRLKEEYENIKINLSFYDSEGHYADSAATRGKVMIVSVYDARLKAQKWNRLASFICDASGEGFKPILLVASTPEEISKEIGTLDAESRNTLERHIYFADYKTLVTMNRSNGGLTYFSDGYLIRKWAGRSLPDRKELHEIATGDDTETIIGHSTQSSLTFQAFLLYVFAIMLLL